MIYNFFHSKHLLAVAALTLPAMAQVAQPLDPPLVNWPVANYWSPGPSVMRGGEGAEHGKYSAAGAGTAAAGSVNAAAGIGIPLSFVAITPCRVADTRGQGFTGQFGPPSLAAKVERTFNLPAGGCGLPASAAAYSLNFTVLPRTTLFFLSVYPAGTPQPTVSTLNDSQGATLANAAIVPAGTNGGITAYAFNDTDLIIDANGYFTALPRTSSGIVNPNGSAVGVAPGVTVSHSGTGQYTVSFPAGSFAPGIIPIPAVSQYAVSPQTLNNLGITLNNDGSGTLSVTFSGDTSFTYIVVQNN